MKNRLPTKVLHIHKNDTKKKLLTHAKIKNLMYTSTCVST